MHEYSSDECSIESSITSVSRDGEVACIQAMCWAAFGITLVICLTVFAVNCLYTISSR